MAKANKKPLIFLSHIHEEKALAELIKARLEDEFSGYAEVFVSSDGTSIPTGVAFLDYITDALMRCCGAIYLISPKSVMRPWINFELGAVWLRRRQAYEASKPIIPTLPICHSGMLLDKLPKPIDALNGIQANDPDGLRRAFTDLQIATGGGGTTLKTDFAKLVKEVKSYEQNYTTGDKLAELFHLALPADKVIEFLNWAYTQRPIDPDRILTIAPFWCDEAVYSKLQALAESPALNENVRIKATGDRTGHIGGRYCTQVKLAIGVTMGFLFANGESVLEYARRAPV